MEHYAGSDVSLKESSVSAVDATGKVVGEVKIASEPETLAGYCAIPNGNRIEFILPPMQFMDPEHELNAWNSTQRVGLVPGGSGPRNAGARR